MKKTPAEVAKELRFFDEVDAENMLSDALLSERLNRTNPGANNSIAAIVAYRIASQHKLLQTNLEHSVY